MIEDNQSASQEIEAVDAAAPVEVQSTESAPKEEAKPQSIKEHVEKIKAEASKEEAEKPKVEAPADGVKPEVVAQEKKEEFKPNGKYKVWNQEFEFPDKLKKLATTPEAEKEIKELLEKAHGIEVIKQERAKVQEEHRSLNTTHTQLVGKLHEIQGWLDKGDLSTAFKAIGVSDQHIMQHALKIAELQDLSPEQRKVYDERQQLQWQSYQQEKQLQQYQQMQLQNQSQQRQAELEQVLQRPNVVPVAQAYDQRHGQGKFWDKIKQTGEMHFRATGEDLSADQIVSNLVSELSVFLPQGEPAQSPAPQPQVANQQPQVVKAKPPVIPNTGGSGAISPTGRSPRSIADLKQMAKELG